MTGTAFTIWDSEGTPPNHSEEIYLWNGYSEGNSTHSLLRYVETHGERLRCKYLAWIHDLGESKINGKRLIDHLALEDGLSYWWMTLFVEKSPWKSPSIIDALRLLALEEIIVQKKPKRLCLVSSNQNLHISLRDLCQCQNVAYEWKRLPRKSLWQHDIRSSFRLLPKSIQAFASLIRYLYIRWPFRQQDKSGWVSGENSLFFCSYFFNIVPTQAKEGIFNSRYWEGLLALVKQLGFVENWLQIYYPHDAVPNTKVAMDLVKSFNRKKGFHSFLDAYLSWRLVWSVIKRWFKLTLISYRLRKIKQAFRPQGSQVSLWSLMRSDWYDSILGSTAISNLLWIELFDMAIQDIPHQKKGLYLCENQAWERALIHAWHKHGHGQLIAVAHATVRFWDLRYFADLRTVRSSDSYSMPQADLVALNGKAAIENCLNGACPEETIVECEALRYGYLNDFFARNLPKRNLGDPVRILVLGGFMPAGTIKALKLLEAATSHITFPVEYTVKPHPNYLVNSDDYPSLHFKVVTGPLLDVLWNYDIAFSDNQTSAAADAYFSGLPVVVMLDGTELNFSPLRGQDGVRFVSTPEELAGALRAMNLKRETNVDLSQFFFLDPKLPRWQRILSNRETIQGSIS